MKEVAEVAVSLPLRKTFHYRIPEPMRPSIQVGMRVLVPFKGRKVTGFTIDLVDHPPQGIDEKLKDLDDLLDESPLIHPRMLQFFRWVSDYYLYPLGEVIKTGLPPGLHLESELTVSLTEEGFRRLASGSLETKQARVLEELAREKRMSVKKILKAFPGEVSRAELLLWKNQGLLEMGTSIRGREVRPKLERILKYQEGISPKPLSKKRREILRWIEERREVSFAELRKHFKSPWRAILSLRESGLLSVSYRECSRDAPLRSELKPYPKPELTPDQQSALSKVLEAIRSKRFSPFLIHGVTGSGKTELYLRGIEEVLSQGRQALVLVPEISLTPQLLSRFSDRFGNHLAVLHSAMSRGERYDQWRKIWRGNVAIALGVRSAIFAPFQELGMIIVDEEHEASYKQEEKLKYHARDLAVYRAKLEGATLLLGSATPSLESYYNAEKQKFHLLTLPERIERKPLPRVEIVDLRKGSGLLSERIKKAIQNHIEQGKQSLLFLNRRGFANFILCPDCGFIFKCPNCSVTLTHHLVGRSLRCHYCDYRTEAPGDCPNCQGHRLRGIGVGTERLEEEIKSLFPTARVGRMDRDTTARRRAHHQILKHLESGEIDILIGTQMIVKGLDFPNVTFVGVISADTALHFPDFRSSERTFQLLTQVAGRAGRGDVPGEVIIQTFSPDHYSIVRARDHDFAGFYRDEIAFREALGYPPFSRLINFRVTGNSEKRTERMAEKMGRIGHALLEEGYGKGIEILGPCAAPFAKIKGRFRWQMLAKGKQTSLLHRFARELSLRFEDLSEARGVTLDIDVDPLSVL